MRLRAHILGLALSATVASAEEPLPDVAAVPPGGYVTRAMFTTDIHEREPLNWVTELRNDRTVIFFYTDLRNLTGRTVVHRWKWNGRPMGDVPIEVGGPRWRAYSIKTLHPSWLGEWTVTVVDPEGEVFIEKAFTYVEADAPAPLPDVGAGGAPPAPRPAAGGATAPERGSP
ncbi:MAG: DUF2914 domain-containing protein [Deltaproteobacteria bacterium]|nr:MAG: DUF2914 domain-containing protein [Deltaproteobacteria bacterium]